MARMEVTCEWNVARGIIGGLLGVVYILVLTAIFRLRKSLFGSAYYTFVLSLGISDVITILYLVVVGATACSGGEITLYLFAVCDGADVVSLLTMISIAVYRYVAIARPLAVADMFNFKRQLIAVAVTWLCGILWGFFYSAIILMWPTYIGQKFAFDVRPYTYPLTAINLSGIMVIWTAIILTGVKMRKFANIKKGKFVNASLRKKREVKLYVTTCIVSSFLIYFKATSILSDLVSSDEMIWTAFVKIGELIAYLLFCTVNPFLYLIFDTEIRQATKQLLCGHNSANHVVSLVGTSALPNVRTEHS